MLFRGTGFFIAGPEQSQQRGMGLREASLRACKGWPLRSGEEKLVHGTRELPLGALLLMSSQDFEWDWKEPKGN